MYDRFVFGGFSAKVEMEPELMLDEHAELVKLSHFCAWGDSKHISLSSAH
jgi:hypothetical protein